VLNLSFNNIQRLENLPPGLEELYLNGNCIDHLALNMNKPITTLFHLGLNRNKIRQTALTQIVKVFPNLMCLDLSFNDLCELDPAIIWIKKLTLMRMLSLEGNPLFFTPHYRIIMVEQMPNLKVIDSITVPVDQRRAAE
jgi:Leucine-rich repeat (LRR) protein